ncbi:MAG: type II toxin-antitoxin system Phd/YefM family antitoxin [Aestuariivirga sp.]
MSTMTYSRLRANLKSALDRVCADHEPVVVERQKGGDVVLLARGDYESLQETAYLLRSPANAARLLGALKRQKRARKTYRSIKALRIETGL